MKRILVLAGFVLMSTSVFAEERQDFVVITFPTSASAKTQVHFLHGATILHSFGWKQAREAFQLAQQADPDFALAYWGEALTYNHPLIAEWDPDTPKQVLERLGATKAARLNKAPTDREKSFLGAVNALFLTPGIQ